jgi:hypothetical protein
MPERWLSNTYKRKLRKRESAISALTLMTYQTEITGAEIAVIAIPVAHTRERLSK